MFLARRPLRNCDFSEVLDAHAYPRKVRVAPRLTISILVKLVNFIVIKHSVSVGLRKKMVGRVAVSTRIFFLYVCLFNLCFYSPVNTLRSCRAWSIILSTLFLDRLPKRLTSTKCPYSHSPVTDKCATWISGRERMAVEIISWPNLYESYAKYFVARVNSV